MCSRLISEGHKRLLCSSLSWATHSVSVLLSCFCCRRVLHVLLTHTHTHTHREREREREIEKRESHVTATHDRFSPKTTWRNVDPKVTSSKYQSFSNVSPWHLPPLNLLLPLSPNLVPVVSTLAPLPLGGAKLARSLALHPQTSTERRDSTCRCCQRGNNPPGSSKFRLLHV